MLALRLKSSLVSPFLTGRRRFDKSSVIYTIVDGLNCASNHKIFEVFLSCKGYNTPKVSVKEKKGYKKVALFLDHL
jgi:hypothetical protein